MNCKKVAILSSIPAEIETFRKFIDKEKFLGKDIILAVCGVGKSAAAATTQKLISEQKPDIMIYTGFAGALQDDLELDDIMIISAAVDAEMDVRAFNPDLLLGQLPLTKERIFQTDQRLAKLAMSSPYPYDREIKKGYIATTSVFMDKNRKEAFIKETMPLLEAEINGEKIVPNLIDMESVGFLTATSANNVPCLIIRVVSNTREGDTVDEYLDYTSKTVGMYLEFFSFFINHIEDIKD